MKKLIFVSALLGALLYGTVEASRPTVSTVKTAQDLYLERQVANYVSYPDVLKQVNQKGTVLIRFRVNANNRIAGLAVESDNRRLNSTLQKQLNGRKLIGAFSSPQSEYLVRLRFQPKAS